MRALHLVAVKPLPFTDLEPLRTSKLCNQQTLFFRFHFQKDDRALAPVLVMQACQSAVRSDIPAQPREHMLYASSRLRVSPDLLGKPGTTVPILLSEYPSLGLLSSLCVRVLTPIKFVGRVEPPIHSPSPAALLYARPLQVSHIPLVLAPKYGSFFFLPNERERGMFLGILGIVATTCSFSHFLLHSLAKLTFPSLGLFSCSRSDKSP